MTKSSKRSSNIKFVGNLIHRKLGSHHSGTADLLSNRGSKDAGSSTRQLMGPGASSQYRLQSARDLRTGAMSSLEASELTKNLKRDATAYAASAAATAMMRQGRPSSSSSPSSHGPPHSNFNTPVSDCKLDPNDEDAIGQWACDASPILPVDVRSIGGHKLAAATTATAAASANATGKEGRGGGMEADHAAGAMGGRRKPAANPSSVRKMNEASQLPTTGDDYHRLLTNECLFAMRISRFDLHHTRGGRLFVNNHHNYSGKKARVKPRYICVIRSSTCPLKGTHDKDRTLKGMRKDSKGGAIAADDEDVMFDEDDKADGVDGQRTRENDGSVGEEVDSAYDDLFGGKGIHRKSSQGSQSSISATDEERDRDLTKSGGAEKSLAEEIASFPALVLISLQTDGTHPEVRKILELDQLVSIESVLGGAANTGKGQAIGGSGAIAAGEGSVRLMFKNGDVLQVDCELFSKGAAGDGPAKDSRSMRQLESSNMVTKSNDVSVSSPMVGNVSGNSRLGGDAATRRDRFLYSLLQIHYILCTAVVERAIKNSPSNGPVLTPLPPLSSRNIDRTELQYLCTVNGFLVNSPALVALLERSQRQRRLPAKTGVLGVSASEHAPEALTLQMDDIAYDMMMMLNTGEDFHEASSRVKLFQSEEEEKFAEEVLNAEWKSLLETALAQRSTTGEGATSKCSVNADVVITAENLTESLQLRMRNLEADACRRLIAWEDEKQPPGGESILGSPRHNIDAISLMSLFQTMDQLDVQLAEMEEWLLNRAAYIKPLTDDCRDIEEENRGLEQQWKSYDMLGKELSRLLSGLEVSPDLDVVLRNPRRALSTNRLSGTIDVHNCDKGIEVIKQAGRELKRVLDHAAGGGGVHLRAIFERVEDLLAIADKFCQEVSNIVSEVMRILAEEMMAAVDSGKVAKSDTHVTVARKIRDTQRSFQSSLLSYIKLIEVLALLKAESLPTLRQEYAGHVSDGILGKKIMKIYFGLLPSHKSYAATEASSYDLRDYPPSSTKAAIFSTDVTPVNAEDVVIACQEMLPVIAREAYFTAALFGVSGKRVEGGQRKRMEAVKRSVDDSSVHFRASLSRACGLSENDDGKDAMLALISSIYLNENMEGYIDRQKKGGDHSLSLAYVRSIILELRKRVDKKWVEWVEDNIKWIKANPGVPLKGKRAGIFVSFARFPSYLDHIILSYRAGKSQNHSVQLSKIKIISYYLQKLAGALFSSLQECAGRETTDQQYAGNVMRMENSYFFLECMKKRGNEVSDIFQKQLTAASAMYKQSTDSYLGWMIKREFKGLHMLFSNVSRIRREVGDSDVPIHVPRAQFTSTLAKESSREVLKEKIGTMYLRMEKHLSESSSLLPHAWKSLVRVLYEWFFRWEKLSTQCYNFKLEPGAVEVVRIAKSVGSGSISRASVQPKDVSPMPLSSSQADF